MMTTATKPDTTEAHLARERKARKIADFLSFTVKPLWGGEEPWGSEAFFSELGSMTGDWWQDIARYAGVNSKTVPSTTTRALVESILREREKPVEFKGCDPLEGLPTGRSKA